MGMLGLICRTVFFRASRSLLPLLASCTKVVTNKSNRTCKTWCLLRTNSNNNKMLVNLVSSRQNNTNRTWISSNMRIEAHTFSSSSSIPRISTKEFSKWSNNSNRMYPSSNSISNRISTKFSSSLLSSNSSHHSSSCSNKISNKIQLSSPIKATMLSDPICYK